MSKIINKAVIVLCAVLVSVAAIAGGSNPGLYYGQVPTAAQWNSYFAAKLDYTPGAANTIPYWDGAGNLLNAAISGDCTSAANVLTCTTFHSVGGITAASFNSTNTTTPSFTSSVASGVGFSQTLAASAAASTTGYSLVFNNAQASAVAGVSVDMGSSAQAHDAFLAKGSNAAAADAFMANMQTGFTGNLFHGSVNNVDQYRVDASGNSIQAGLLTQGDATAPAGVSQIGGMFSTNAPASGRALILRASATSTAASAMAFLKSRGTNASPSVIVTGDDLGQVIANGYDGTNYTASSMIKMSSEGTISTGIVPGNIQFQTANASGSVTQALKIDSAQNVLVTGPGGLGYGAGSGGTVTQTTSKSTSVTLNKASGQIIMNNAALAAGASVVFSFMNSYIGNYDTVEVHPASGMAAWGTYHAYVSGSGGGQCAIVVTNISGGSLSESVILNFKILKGAIN